MVNRIIQFTDWFLFTSLFTACCAMGLCMSTERMVSGRIPPFFSSLHVLIFGATLAVYNMHILVRRSTPERSDLSAWSVRNKHWLYIFLVAGILACTASLFFVPASVLVASGIMGALAFFYSVPVLPFRNLKSIRDIGIIKIIVLASVWTTVTTVLPILYSGKSIPAFPYEVTIRFVFIFTLCVAFDIRDIQTDIGASVHTVPVLVGIKNSTRIINTGIVLFTMLGVVQYLIRFRTEQFVGIVITALVTKFILQYVRDHPSDRAYMGLVDGCMLLYAALALLH